MQIKNRTQVLVPGRNESWVYIRKQFIFLLNVSVLNLFNMYFWLVSLICGLFFCSADSFGELISSFFDFPRDNFVTPEEKRISFEFGIVHAEQHRRDRSGVSNFSRF